MGGDVTSFGGTLLVRESQENGLVNFLIGAGDGAGRLPGAGGGAGESIAGAAGFE